MLSYIQYRNLSPIAIGGEFNSIHSSTLADDVAHCSGCCGMNASKACKHGFMYVYIECRTFQSSGNDLRYGSSDEGFQMVYIRFAKATGRDF